MTGIAGLFTPLLAHMLVLQLVALVCSSWMDAASMTTLAALILCLPMYRQVKKEDPQSKIKNIPSLLIPFVLGVAGNLLGSWLMDAAGMYDNFSNASQEALYDSSLWIQIAGLGILVPITEELIFRGLIERRASKRWGAAAGIFLSAALFSVYHGNMIQMVYAFPMGLLLGWSYWKWDNLTAPILLHVGANLCGVVMQFLHP